MRRYRTALFAAAVALVGGAAVAAPVATPPEARWFDLGSLKLASLHDAGFVAANDGKTFGVDAGPAAVAKVLARAGAPTDTVAVSVNALLVKLPGHIVLLDTGFGPQASGGLIASLAKAGLKPDDITDVLITHGHGDHAGGLASDGKPAFPKAIVRMSAKEWASIQADPAAGPLVAAIGAQVHAFEPGTAVLPGITPIAIDGHTPGHVGYEIVSGQARLLDIGDTAHSSIVSLAEPQWAMGFDGDKPLARSSRIATLARLAKSHELIFAPHFPFPGVGRIVAQGSGFAWAPGLK